MIINAVDPALTALYIFDPGSLRADPEPGDLNYKFVDCKVNRI